MPVDVLCIGHACYDVTMYLSEYPAENSKAETYDSLECGGGPAANAACLLAIYGVRTAFAGLVGDDLYGHAIHGELRKAGVNTSLLEMRADHPTPLSVLLVNNDNASRTIINRKAESAPYHPDPNRLANLEPEFLLFDGHELEASLDALEAFPNATTVLDAGSLRPGTETLAPKVDYLLASERFACQVAGIPSIRNENEQAVALNALRRLNKACVVITLGERGLVYEAGEQMGVLPAYKVNTVDTAGAGDVFHGAFVCGLVSDLELTDCLRLASAAAALSVTSRGARTSIPAIEQLQEFVATSPAVREL